jgi:hypothetical protein
MNEQSAFFTMYGPSTGTNQGGNFESTTVTATNASATASVQFSGNADSNSFFQIQIANKTTAWAHVEFGRFGNVELATVADSYPVAPGSVVIVSVSAEVSGASVILDAAPGTATAVIFTRGVGL